LLAARLSPNDFFAGQPEPRRYRVRRGDTVASVADLYGVTPEALARLNRIRTSGKLKVGHVISVPEPSAGTLVAVAATSATVAVGSPATAPAVAAETGGEAPSSGTSATPGVALNGAQGLGVDLSGTSAMPGVALNGTQGLGVDLSGTAAADAG